MRLAYPRPSRSVRSRRVRGPLGVLIASMFLLASAIGPATAASPLAGAPGLAGGHRTDTGTTVGRGTRIDARVAARDAAKAPRIHKALKRLKPNVGAKSAAKGASASSRNIAGTQKGGFGTGIQPKIVAQPGPIVSTSFPGIAMWDACNCEPPDPWIAVSSSYVVQTTNGMTRISNRVGTPLVSMPNWAMFNVPIDRFDSDPRILWDAFHGRWVGILMTSTGLYDQTGLRLAISETADPTAGWIVYSIETGNHLPDYPGISSSSDKIVLTSNDFLDGLTYEGPSFFVVDWANVLAGTSLYVRHIAELSTTDATFRPAIMLSSAPNIPVIYEFGDHVGYFEITGNAHTAVPDVNGHDLTLDFGSQTFTLPPAPVQPGAVEITGAADERPTDAVYRNGVLWFAATGDYNDGVDDWAMSRYTQVLTTANGAAPTAAADLTGSNSGTHYFMPGIGIDAHGSAILSATMTDPTSVYPTTVVGGVMAGSGLYPYVAIEASTLAYQGIRWGDYVGIAADPAATGAVWMAHELVANDGSWRTSVVRIVSDAVSPGSPGAVRQSIVTPSTLGVTVPVKVTWGAASDSDSGVAGYLVERDDDSLGFAGAITQGLSITQPLQIGHTAQYRVSAVDAYGNIGTPTYGPVFRPTLYQQTSSTSYSGTWSSSSNAAYSGGSVKYASAAGKTATFTATNARSIAFITTKAPSRGSFKVYVDGVLKATVSTYSATTKYRQLIYQFTWATAGTHKIKIYVKGTSGHPRVDIDAFVVLR
jgi:hypothetical protein